MGNSRLTLEEQLGAFRQAYATYRHKMAAYRAAVAEFGASHELQETLLRAAYESTPTALALAVGLIERLTAKDVAHVAY